MLKQSLADSTLRQQDRKRTWWITVKTAILKYQSKILEGFLPVLVKDFSTSQIVKFHEGKMNQEDIEVVKEFMVMVEKSSMKKLEKELVREIEEVKVPEEKPELVDKLKDITRAVKEGHQWIFTRIENYIRSMVKETLYKNTVDRSKIEFMLYNFVEGNIPEAVKAMLKNGMNSVPSMKLTKGS